MGVAARRREKVSSGLDVLVEKRFAPLRGLAVGLICTPTAVDRRLRHAADLLREARNVRLAALFGPEHGVRGDVQYMSSVKDERDRRTGVPVYSLYGSDAESLRPKPRTLRGLDALVFDIQDVEARCYTYQATMLFCMEAAARAKIAFCVRDRPNPIGGAGGAVGGGAAARSCAPGDSLPRLAAGYGSAQHRASVGLPLAQHADAGDGARLPRDVPSRGDERKRGARHHAAVRAVRGAGALPQAAGG